MKLPSTEKPSNPSSTKSQNGALNTENLCIRNKKPAHKTAGIEKTKIDMDMIRYVFFLD